MASVTVVIARFDPTGASRWVQRFGGAEGAGNFAYAMLESAARSSGWVASSCDLTMRPNGRAVSRMRFVQHGTADVAVERQRGA